MMQQSSGPSVPTRATLADALTAADIAYSEPVRAGRLAADALASGGDDKEIVSAAERALGMASAAAGDLGGAADHLRRAVAVADAAGLPLRAGQARGSLAYVLLLTTGAADALAELDRADADVDTGVTAARLQMQRGLVLSEIHRLDEAAASLDHALATLSAAGGDHLLEADIRNNRSIVALNNGHHARAHEDLALAEALYAQSHQHGRTAMVIHNRAVVYARQGEIPAALAAFDDAARRYRDAGLHPGLLDVERAEALLAVGLAHEARAAATVAVGEFVRRANAVDLVQARLLVADAALRAGDPAVALVDAGYAAQAAEDQARPRWVALADLVGIRARWADGDHSPDALQAAGLTADRLAAAGWPGPALEARLVAARTAIALGRFGVARRDLDRVRSSRSSGGVADRVRGWHAEALRRQVDGDRTGAAHAVRTGLTVLADFQAGLGATDLRAHVAANAEDLARLGLELAVDGGRPRAVLAAAERWRAGALRTRPARPPDDGALAHDLAALRQASLDEYSDDAATAAAATARGRRLEHAVRARARHATALRGARVATPSVSDLAAALGPRVLIQYVEHDGRLLAVTVRDGRARLHELGPTEGIATAVDRLRTSLRWLTGLGRSKAADRLRTTVERRAADLERVVFGALPNGYRDRPLVLVPTGALHAVPWAVLPVCAGRAVTVAPSAAVWWRAATAPPDVVAGPAVFAHGPGLPHAAAEVAELARSAPGSTLLTGPDASVAAVLAALDGADHAHLAAHGRFRADNPMFSALSFADGPLTVHDLERLGRAPRHVVLASCDSGLTSVTSGDEVVGLAAALLASGTRTLVAAVVPVPDDASRTLLLRFHHHVSTGIGAADALVLARHDVADRTLDIAAAGFVCFGAG